MRRVFKTGAARIKTVHERDVEGSGDGGCGPGRGAGEASQAGMGRLTAEYDYPGGAGGGRWTRISELKTGHCVENYE